MSGAGAGTGTEGRRGEQSDLFGRGMAFVVIWSMQMVVATIISPVLAHVLPVTEFGSLAAAIAMYQLLLIVAVFGLDQALEMHRVEEGTQSRQSRGLLAAGIGFAFLTTGVVAAGSPWWGPALGFSSGTLVLVALLWTAPGAGVLVVLSLLQAEDRLFRFSVVSLISTVGSQLFGIALLFTVERSAVGYAWGGVAGQGLALLLGIWWTRPRWRGAFDRPQLRRAFGLGVPLVLAALSEFVLAAGDRFAVQRWLGPVELARYQVAFTVGNVVTLLLLFTNRAWLPRLKAITDVGQRWRAIAESRDGVYWLVGWALLGITVAAPALLRVFAPPSYEQSTLAPVVLLVGLCALPVTASGASSRLLVTTRQTAPLIWSSAAAVLVKVAATVVGLQWWGLSGAAAATLLALTVQALWLRVAIARHRPMIDSQPVVLAFVAASVLLSAISTVLPQDTTWNVGRFVFGCLCLAPFAHALRCLQRGRPPLGRRHGRRAIDGAGPGAGGPRDVEPGAADRRPGHQPAGHQDG